MRTLNFVFLLIPLLLFACTKEAKYTQPELDYRSAEIMIVEGYQFKDLNKNGLLDLYEDWRLSTHERVQNLLSQMTLDEKVGFM
ncbi:MAG: glycoside hydrolase family 3 protein, partial [Cyclobacteriaceae bacterium]|nr:glycoside hydrolase family 3 protein [Cyclobacteriaceae bacterium]